MKDSWERVKLGDICISYAGGTPNRGKSQYYNGEIPWVSSGEVNKDFIIETNEHITEEGLKYSSAKWIPKDAILLAMYGATAGQVSKLKIKATSNQAVLALIPSEANDYFIYYTLKFIKSKILFLAQGSGQPNLSKSLIDNTIINLPPLPQQRKIAEILSTVDAVLEKTEAAIAKYQQLKQGLMQDVFTRGIDVHTGQLRPKQTEAPELYKQSALGWIPKEWEVMRMGDILKITTGGRDTQDRVENGKYPFYVRSQNIERINTYSFDGVGILTAGDGVGTGKVFHFVNGKIDFHQRVYLLYDFEENIIPEYVFEYFKLNFIHRVEKFSAKNTVDSVRLEMISDMLIPISIEQNKISKILNNLNQKIHTEQQALAKYQQLKAGLLQDLLTGRVEVRV